MKKADAYNRGDIYRIAQKKHGVVQAEEIAKEAAKGYKQKEFDIPLPDSIGYTQHVAECVNDSLQEIFMFADGLREYTQPIIYGLTHEQMQVRSNTVLKFSDWNRYADYFAYLQKRFRVHYDVLNYMRTHKIAAEKFFKDYEEVCALDPIFRKKKAHSLEAGILLAKKLKQEMVYTETGFPVSQIPDVVKNVLKWFGVPYKYVGKSGLTDPNTVGVTFTVQIGNIREKNGIPQKQTMLHQVGFVKMLGSWYYYDNEVGFVKADLSIIKALQEGKLLIIQYKTVYFCKMKESIDDKDEFSSADKIVSTWKNGKWEPVEKEAFLTESAGFQLYTQIFQPSMKYSEHFSGVAFDHTLTSYNAYYGFLVPESAEDLLEDVAEFKDNIYYQSDSNSRVFEDLYRYLFENIGLTYGNPELLSLLKTSETVIGRPACTPMIHYWCYKIRAALHALTEDKFDWFSVPQLRMKELSLYAVPKETPPEDRAYKERLEKLDKELREKQLKEREAKLKEQEEKRKELEEKRKGCPPETVYDVKTGACRERKKAEKKSPVLGENGKPIKQTRKKYTPCEPGQIRNAKTKKCKDRVVKKPSPCPPGQIRDKKTGICREPEKYRF